MTWRLHRIVLYSHQRERYLLPEAGFEPIGVNIIVGDSNTGKSAILEIVNYCFGSTNCDVADYIRQRCSWIGIQLKRDDQYLFVCRMVPPGSRRTSTSYFLKAGMSDEPPATKDDLRDMGAGVIDHLDQLLGIGTIKLEDNTNPSGFTVSTRHCVPYSLMRDDVIISKDAIISGDRDERARHLRETLPYFLGHITEETIRLREELRRKRAELRARQSEFDQLQSLNREGTVRLSSFVDQGRSLGIIPPAEALESPEEQRILLRDVANFRAGVAAAPPDSERHALDEDLREVRRKLTQLQEHRRAIRQTASDAGSRLEEQVGRSNTNERMDDDAMILSGAMKDLISKFPFAATYENAIPIFDWKNLQVHLLVDGSRKVRMPAIGSDENYLAIHLSFFLSIQKLFAERRKPVPQFIILDQVTRPYFPDTDFKEIVDLTMPPDDAELPSTPVLSDERAKVKRIIATLFEEAATPNAPQIIICEKATFRDDPTYTNAIVAVWAAPDGMVPSSWATSNG